MAILLVADMAEDPAPPALLRELAAQGAEAVLVDTSAWRTRAATATLTWRSQGPPSGGLTTGGRQAPPGGLAAGGRQIPWDALRSAWLWRPWFGLARPDQPESQLAPEAQRFFRQQWHRFGQGFYLFLAQTRVFCVNPVPAGPAGDEKIWQLELARRLGLTIPDTLITTDMAAARDFFAAQGGDIIYKPIRAPLVERPASAPGRERFATVYTNRVRLADLERPDRFLPSPCLFQARLPKRLEVRVTLIGRHTFAAAIDAQGSARADLDWRRYDDANTRYSPYDLPADIAAKLIALLQELGLVYGAADLVVTPAGEHVFLEINPSGQYYWIERLTGLPLTANLARMLMAAEADYEPCGPHEPCGRHRPAEGRSAGALPDA